MPYPESHSRRKFLTFLGGMAAAGALPAKAATGNILTPDSAFPADKSLSLLNLHTGESLKSTFFSDGQYHHEEIHALNILLRDHRNDQTHMMDPRLLDLLHRVQSTVSENKQIHIISAYRSPATNELLRKNSNKVAKKSYHMQGKAIDIRVPGVNIKHLHQAALSMKGGGVGLYSRSNFVHLDVGRVRRWGA